MNRKHKTILMVTDGLYPYLNANSEIVYRIANILQRDYLCDINILGVAKDLDKAIPNNSMFKTLYIITMATLNKILKEDSSKLIRILRMISHPKCLRYMIFQKYDYDNAERREYRNAIQHAIKKVKPDCIIVFFAPRNALRAMADIKTKIPFISYKLDPWRGNYYLRGREKANEEERKADMAAAAIITTDLIRKEYERETTQQILDKIHELKFPNIVNYENGLMTLEDTSTINCVFAGALYKNIRNPVFTIKLFEKLRGEKCQLHIYGKSYVESGIPQCLPENVYNHGFVPSDEALAYMQSADVLVNIGNTVLNQMPSKLLTYISLGKPILNIIKDPNCPTIPYLEKYPLALTILETEVPTEEDIKIVREFILESKGQHIPFEEIRQMYYDCTPEYVGGKVYEIICKVIEESKSGKHKNR